MDEPAPVAQEPGAGPAMDGKGFRHDGPGDLLGPLRVDVEAGRAAQPGPGQEAAAAPPGRTEGRETFAGNESFGELKGELPEKQG